MIDTKLETWQEKLLDAFHENFQDDISDYINSKISEYKKSVFKRFVDYHAKNNLPISYSNDEDLINQAYEIGIIRKISDLNKEFIANHQQ